VTLNLPSGSTTDELSLLESSDDVFYERFRVYSLMGQGTRSIMKN